MGLHQAGKQFIVWHARLPETAGVITGTAALCDNQQGVVYAADAINGTIGYVWSYSGTGLAITSGENTNRATP